MLSATVYLKSAGKGGSKAMLVDCDDGLRRVVKLMGNPQDDRVLVNELVVGRVAGLLNAPCPDVAVISVPNAVVNDAKHDIGGLDNAKSGLAFASTWIAGTYHPSPAICQNAHNRKDLINLLGLYTWVRNTDLKAEHLLYTTSSRGTTNVSGFDHGHCIGSPGWAAAEFGTWPTKKHVVQRTALDDAVEYADIARFEQLVLGIGVQEIEASTRNVPDEWGATAADLAALGEALDKSRVVVVDALRERFQT